MHLLVSTNYDEIEDLGGNSDGHQSDESSSNCETEEIWNRVLPEMLSRDIESAPPLPEFQHQQTS